MPTRIPVRHGLTAEPPADIAFLYGRLPMDVLESATRDAARLGAEPHEILLSRGDIGVVDYYAVLAASLGARFSPFVPIHTPVDPLAGRDPSTAARIGMLKVAGESGIEIAAAPRGRKVAAFVEALRDRRAAGRRVFVAPPQALTDAIVACGRETLLAKSLNGLGRLSGELSAGTRAPRWQAALLIGTASIAVVAGIASPDAAMLVVTALLALFFLGAIGLRLLAAVLAFGPDRGADTEPLPDADLPVYTVLVPLYREANQVGGLLEALGRLDYPPHKLDIKLIAEADDTETLAALRRHVRSARFEIVVVPDAPPKTKPKALCFALAFARGSLVTIYDAEDLPEPGQLRLAAARLAALPSDVVCLQARLAWYNWPESWFTRQLALEYASLFDVFLPALARLGLPLPLGGTSNHFSGLMYQTQKHWVRV